MRNNFRREKLPNEAFEYVIKDFKKLILTAMYYYHRAHGLNKLLSSNKDSLFFNYPQNIQYEEFLSALNTYRNRSYNPGSTAKQPTTQYDEIFKRFASAYFNFRDDLGVFRSSDFKDEKTPLEEQNFIFFNCLEDDIYKLAILILTGFITSDKISKFSIYIESPVEAPGTLERPYKFKIFFENDELLQMLYIIRTALEQAGVTLRPCVLPGIGVSGGIIEAEVYLGSGRYYLDSVKEIVEKAIEIHPNDWRKQAEMIYGDLKEKYKNLIELADKVDADDQLLKHLNYQSNANNINRTETPETITATTTTLITFNPQARINFLCLAGGAIIDDEDKRQIWYMYVDQTITEQNYGSYLDDVLNIMAQIKAGIPIETIKSIVTQTSNLQLILQYLQTFVEPHVFEQLSSRTPQGK